MSFLTALFLSFNNLLTKKGRTLMTAFAGSIGIIGIAAILSLANGVNSYIANVEEEHAFRIPAADPGPGLRHDQHDDHGHGRAGKVVPRVPQGRRLERRRGNRKQLSGDSTGKPVQRVEND